MNEEIATQNPQETEDTFKEVVEAQFKKIQRQSMLIGAQAACRVVIDKIVKAETQPGKRTMNDYRRLIKDIRHFCEIGVSRKVNADGETESSENNTKLMEEVNDQN